jgi:glucose/arabinose dehydrogenase
LEEVMMLDSSSLPLVVDSSINFINNSQEQIVGLIGESHHQELVFIDAAITDAAILTSKFHNARVIQLNGELDGIDQITNVLGQSQDIASIHIISHGSQGDIQLGNSHLNWASLPNYGEKLQQWRAALTTDADVLFYGCNIGAGVEGGTLVREISQITGADIAASNNLTGNAALGGDWNLEVHSGKIEAPTESIVNYQGILPIYNGKEYLLTNSAKSWTDAQAEATSLGGNLVTINNAAEENWLKQTFGSSEQLWIGLTDRTTEGTFKWVNGETATYRNWNPGEPNNFNFGGAVPEGEDYAVINQGTQWNDIPNTYAGNVRGIIERNIDDNFAYDGKKYRLTTGAKSWTDAQAEATSLGGNLVTINNAAEENWLKQTFGSSEQLWIGLTDRTTEGKFEWVNGETATYRNWNPGEPNNSNFGGAVPEGEDYAVINQGTQWNDIPNTYAGNVRGIIEINADSPTAGLIGLETSNYQIAETNNQVNVAILRQGGSDGTVTVDYRTVDASAKTGSDYQAVSGRVTFAPGETRKSIAVPILNDNLAEGDEQFNLTIDNVLGGATLSAPRTATITITDDEAPTPLVAFNDFTNITGLTLNGQATKSGNRLRLTEDLSNQASTAFLNRPLAIAANTSFSTKFEFQIGGQAGTNGRDGFTFMLQNSLSTTKALGNLGGNLGYSGISKSLAIEFDTFQNEWDSGNNQISVLRDGVVDKSAITANAPLDLNSGNRLTAWIDYDGATNKLAVFLAQTATKPNAAVLTYNIDLPTVVGNQAFLGFSAGSGNKTNTHDLLNWSLSSNSDLLPAPNPTPVGQKQTTVANLSQPIAIDWAPDGSKMFIAEKGGVIKVFENGQLKTTPFIDLSSVVNSARDRGLLDIAVHPDFFKGKPYIYASYTYDPAQVAQNSGLAGADGNGNRANRLTRIAADPATNYTTAIAGSEVVILGKNSTWNNFNAFANSTVDFNEKPAGILADGTNLRDFIAQDSESHVGGSLQFTSDGALFVSIGDGISYNQLDPRGVRVQDIDNLSGKILRIDPLTGAGLADNPFYNGDSGANRSKVYQSGLRNPFRTTIDARNGQLYIGDVGWTQWEEINAGGAGANFGWPYYEGGNRVSLRTGSYQDLPAAKAFYASGKQVTPASLALNHAADGIDAIILGDIYTGTKLPEKYRDNLFFNDLGQGIVRNAKVDAVGKITSAEIFATDAKYVVQITQGPDGELYYVDLDDGVVGRWQVG